MKKKVIKFILIFLIIFVLSNLFMSVMSHASFSSVDVDFVTDGAKDSSGAAQSFNNIVGSILTICQVAGSGIAVIMLIVLAIKYMSAAPSDKAEVKKSATIYIIGAVLLFSASGILGIIRRFAKTNISAIN